MKKIISEIGVGVALLLAGAVISYFIFRPSPLAFGRCEPINGSAPLSVECYNQSNYYKNIIWDFGDEEARKIKDEDTVQHTYDSPGSYTISLYAHGQGASEPWEQLVKVKEVLALSSPFDVSIIGKTKDNAVIRNRNIQINNTKDDHPSTFSDHTRGYSQTIRAEAGYKITDANFIERSAARATHINSQIQDNGDSLRFSYSLTSGPAVDRYRGWLHGTLTVEETRIEPGSEITLASDISIRDPGSYTLSESVPLDSIQQIIVSSPNGEAIASGNANEVVVLTDKQVAMFLIEENGKLLLRVENRNN